MIGIVGKSSAWWLCSVLVGFGAVLASCPMVAAAAAVAWTLENIAKYGGDPKKVYVSDVLLPPAFPTSSCS